MPPGTIDGSTRLVLTNAIYFNATWSWPFDKKVTQKRTFHLAGGSRVEVPMMTATSKDFYGYAKGNGYQAVDVPYSRGEMSMTVLLPDEGTFREFEDALDADALDQILDGIEIDYITLTMPLFKFESEFSLSETLAGMGMPDAFDARADFSGMTGFQGPVGLRSRSQGIRIGGRRGHGGSCGHERGGKGVRPHQGAHPGCGQPALHLPYPGQGHRHGPVPGPHDEPARPVKHRELRRMQQECPPRLDRLRDSASRRVESTPPVEQHQHFEQI